MIKAHVERENVRLVIPYAEKELSFAYPGFGPGYYWNVGHKILDSGLILPTGGENASLLYESAGESESFRKSSEAHFVRDKIMRYGWMWVFNRNLIIPKNESNPGIYIQHDSLAKGMSEKLDRDELEDCLSGGTLEKRVRFSEDGKTAFAPESTLRHGVHRKGDLSQNGFIIASFGAEGAYKLDELSKKFIFRPCVDIASNPDDSVTQSVSAIDWKFFRFGGLHIVGNGNGSYWYGGSGYSFGKINNSDKK